MSALELVIDLPFLASEVNDAHRQITFHARSMLLEAKRAGDALLAAKTKVKHGEFKAWVEANCRCSYRSSAEYMQVAKFAKNADLRTFEGGVRAFLEVHAKPRTVRPSPTPELTANDAERVLNIAARATQGLGAEKEVAAGMLSKAAERYGLSVDALLKRSKALCPDRDKSADEKARGDQEAEILERVAELEVKIKRIMQMHLEYANYSRQELLNALVNHRLVAEGIR